MEFLEDSKFDDDDVVMIVVEEEQDTEEQSSGVIKTEETETLDDVSQEESLLSEELDIKPEPGTDGSDYVQDETNESAYDEEEYLEEEFKKEHTRIRLRPPEEQESYVNELREQNPVFEENEELLVNKLLQIMRDVKRPIPPNNYFMMIDNLYVCSVCAARKDTEPAISRHWQQTHGPRYAICLACGMNFRNVATLYRHEKRCNAPDSVFVLKARARMLGRKGRSRPFMVNLPNPKEKFPCDKCPEKFKSARKLRIHALKHAGPRPHRCEICSAAYSKPLSLYKHRREKHFDSYPCELCGRMFPSKYNLKLHMGSHSKLKNYACPHCDKRYARNRPLRIHINREHLQLPPPFACHACPKKYYRTEELKDHLLRVHGMNMITHNSFKRVLPYLSDTQVEMIQTGNKSELIIPADKANTVDEILLYTQANEADNAAKPDKTIEIEILSDKRFDFLQCSEKIESASEMSLKQEPVYSDGDDVGTESQASDGDNRPEDIPEDLLEYANNLHEGDDKTKPVIVIKNGQAIFMDKNNVDFYKQNVRKKKTNNTKVSEKKVISKVGQRFKLDKPVVVSKRITEEQKTCQSKTRKKRK